MDKQLTGYVRHHIIFVSSLVIVGFLLLAAGEYYLYRQQMYLNKMVSEGFMQLKDLNQEENNADDSLMIEEKVMEEEVAPDY